MRVVNDLIIFIIKLISICVIEIVVGISGCQGTQNNVIID